MTANPKKQPTHSSTKSSTKIDSVTPESIQPEEQFFNSSVPKTPLALWGIVHLVTEATLNRVTKWMTADSNEARDRFLGEAQRELASFTKRVSSANDGLGMDETVLTLAASRVWADGAVLGLAKGSDRDLNSIADWARANDAIENLLIKSLGIEIGLLVALKSENIKMTRARDLADEFEAVIEENLDADGWPDSRLLDRVDGLAGCWARVFDLLKLGGVELSGGVQIQLEWFARQCMRLRSKAGTMILGRASAESVDSAFWDAVTSMSHDPDDAVIAGMLNNASREVESDKPKRTQLRPSIANKLVAPSNVSVWAESFLLRSSWHGKSPRVAVNFSNPESGVGSANSQQRCFTEIARTIKLVSGEALPEIQVDGELANFEGGFDVVCQVHDQDLDYVEMQVQLSTGGHLNRQWLLSRKNEFLLVADSVVPSASSDIDYRCLWPLADGVTTMAESETREVYLQDAKTKKIKSLVLPLCLPEWSAERFRGGLHAHSDSVVLEQQCQGEALFAALVFDLKPNRSVKKRTWRQLTVSENRLPVAADQGVAFRFQLNNRQWFFYRSLASSGNRTFLGQNVVSEFAFYRFHSDGKVTSMIEVE